MSKRQQTERAFFTSLHEYNSARDETKIRKVGLIAALVGDACHRHVERYYPECARE